MLTTLDNFFNTCTGFLFGPIMLCVFFGTGILMTVITRGVQFRKFGVAVRTVFGNLKKKESGDGQLKPFEALATALSGCVGNGNVVGVVAALVSGGPGAIFWMWVAAITGMATKYAEIMLAMHYREKDDKGIWRGGVMYILTRGMKDNWKWLGKIFAVVFALCCVLVSFISCNAVQSSSIVSVLGSSIPAVPGWVWGLIFSALSALVIMGGLKKIGSVCSILTPVMAIVYIIASLIIIFANITHIGKAFGMIFQGAFNAEAALGAAFGITIKTSITKGIARGCFSNEAGLGSAPMAHAATSEKDPVKQGFFGIFEVFMDTIIICTLTSLVVLTTVAAAGGESVGIAWGTSGGASIVTACMARIISGGVSGVLVAVCLSLFAFSTILSWSLYGTRCFEYLFGTKASIGYKIVFILFAVVGATLSLNDAWNLADALNGFMAIPNLVAVLMLSPVVIRLTKEYFAKNRNVESLADTAD